MNYNNTLNYFAKISEIPFKTVLKSNGFETYEEASESEHCRIVF